MAATDRESSAVPSDSGTAATTNETTTSSPSQIQILDGMNLAMVAIEQWCRERVSVVWAAAACGEANGRRRTEKANDDEFELSRSLAASVPSPSLERTPHAARCCWTCDREQDCHIATRCRHSLDGGFK